MPTFRALLLGDFHFGESYRTGGSTVLKEHGYEYAIKHLHEFADRADHIIVNLETPLLGPSKTRSPLKGIKPYIHWGDKDKTLEQLKKLQVDAVNLANNHTGDFGQEGLIQTLEALDSASISYFGAGHNRSQAKEPYIFSLPPEMGGTKVEIHGALQWSKKYSEEYDFYAKRDSAGVSSISARSAELMRPRFSDSVSLFMPHWLTNYLWATERQYNIINAIAPQGFTFLVGHGAHCLQEIELLGSMPAVFSIGNGVFQSGGKFDRHVAGRGILPYGAWTYLTFERDIATFTASIRQYPVYADNRSTNFQPYPISAVDFELLSKRYESDFKAYRAQGGTIFVGQDDLGHYIELKLDL